MLKWGSFNEWPSLSFEDVKSNLFQKENEIEPHHRPWKRSKKAMIFGPLHVHTFDDTLYDSAEYSSDCSFILAHDLRKSSFTVLSTKTAIHMLFPDTSVSVNDKNQVFINGSQIETNLPFVAYDRKITVFRSNVIEVESPSLKVVCSGKDFLCVLELRVWHHGGIFGLLGNSDGLKTNDFMLPNGKLTSDVLEFVKSYEVSGNPECKNLRLPMPPPFLVGVDESCRSQFYQLCDQDKIFRESFIDFCKSDFQDDSKACYARAGYSAMCYFKNLKSKPIDCHGEKQESSRIEQKLEIILIVQEHKSLTSPEVKNSPYEGIESMVTALEDKFKANGYSSVLFSLVGFGRKGAYYQPTVHSSKNSTWVPVQAMVKELIKSLVFDGDENADAINALRYAVEVLGYDSFHSKVVIVLTLKDKQRTEKKTLHLVQSQLKKNGITLYSLSSYPSVEKGKKVFGVRADGSIVPSPKKDGSASLSFPKGDLAKLATATRGSVFLSNFISSNAPASYFVELAEEVWAKVHEESQSCRDCTAVKSGWWWKVNQCSIETC